MSELRQRKGETTDSESKHAHGGQQPTEAQRRELVEKFQETSAAWLENLKPKPKPGTSNAAKKLKDELLQDPYNLETMLGLGKEYADMHQWDRCMNVLLRGWKRVSELKNAEDRYEFLALLCQVSLELNKHKQALAVLNDIDQPEGAELEKELQGLKCQVYGHNGDTARCLKAFNDALTGIQLQDALRLWTMCSSALKQADGFTASKTALEKLATTDEEKKQVEMVEKLCNVKDQYMTVTTKTFWNSTEGVIAIAILVFAFMLLLAGLYWLEQKSLKHWKFV
eukprot:TRINITY_DN32453_c0_g1_i1.p1 TRINITY_DN32453_c0_g1~~TRINITY_DN32453_c0_g1_i1.p1  ORF type:complete len:297 (-),score=59.25 TRINITY_DN32453_c0_g1_i1:169-1014(-)